MLRVFRVHLNTCLSYFSGLFIQIMYITCVFAVVFWVYVQPKAYTSARHICGYIKLSNSAAGVNTAPHNTTQDIHAWVQVQNCTWLSHTSALLRLYLTYIYNCHPIFEQHQSYTIALNTNVHSYGITSFTVCL